MNLLQDSAYIKYGYAEVLKRKRDKEERKRQKMERRKRREILMSGSTSNVAVCGAIDSPIGFLFPGQGSQAVGMLKESKDLPAVKDMLAKAERILGYDILKICMEGEVSMTLLVMIHNIRLWRFSSTILQNTFQMGEITRRWLQRMSQAAEFPTARWNFQGNHLNRSQF